MQTTQQTNNSSLLIYLFYGLVLLAIIGVIVSLSMSTPAHASVGVSAKPQAQGMMRGPLASASTGGEAPAKKEFLLTTDEDGNMQHSPIELNADNKTIFPNDIRVKGPHIRINHGKRGMILRNDGDNTYFLHTAENDPDGVENANRPLTINNASGSVSMGNGLTVNGGLNVPSGNVSATGQIKANNGFVFDNNQAAHIDTDGALYRTGGQAYLTVDDNLYIRDSGHTSGNQAFRFKTNEKEFCIDGVCINADHLKMLRDRSFDNLNVSGNLNMTSTNSKHPKYGKITFPGWELTREYNVFVVRDSNSKNDTRYAFGDGRGPHNWGYK